MKRTVPQRCINCSYYKYDRIDDIYACANTKYLVPTLMNDCCSRWKGERTSAMRKKTEVKNEKLQHMILPTAEDRKKSF